MCEGVKVYQCVSKGVYVNTGVCMHECVCACTQMCCMSTGMSVSIGKCECVNTRCVYAGVCVRVCMYVSTGVCV